MAEVVASVLIVLFWLLLAAVVAVVFLWRTYNGLQHRSESVREHGSNLEAGMKTKRALVVQLNDLVKGYTGHEALTQISVAAKENEPRAASASGLPGNVVGAFSQMARDYPDLKANETYQSLMTQLEKTDRQLSTSYEIYNRVAKDYNIYLKSLPTVLFASRLGFSEAPFFAVSALDDVAHLADFRTDSGEMLKSFLGDFGKSIGEGGRVLTEAVGRRGKELAEYGRSKLEQKRGD